MVAICAVVAGYGSCVCVVVAGCGSCGGCGLQVDGGPVVPLVVGN